MHSCITLFRRGKTFSAGWPDVRESPSNLTAVLDPLAAHTSPGGALISFGETAAHYDSRAVEFEAFARPLWGLASLLLGGGSYARTDDWVRGLAAGTDPASPEYWGASRAKDQRMVEMSPLSFAICLQPDVFFTVSISTEVWQTCLQLSNRSDVILSHWMSTLGLPLTDRTRVMTRSFTLRSSSTHARISLCPIVSLSKKELTEANWLWFRVFANLALRSIGSPLFDAARMEKDLQRLDSFQLDAHGPIGDDKLGSSGWSRDGPEGVKQLDYYSGSFAIQVAQMVYAKLCADSDPVRARTYRERATSFALDLMYYFSPTGEGIPFGRSMVYRFAIISTFSAMALCDIPPPPGLQWGHIKGVVLRHLRSWSSKDAIFRSDGTLNIGYMYDQFHLTENYNAPGSVYWCCKAFLCLGASASHPFWSSHELPWPSQLPTIKALPDPMHIMVHGKHTYLLSSGQTPHYGMRNGAAKYAKFAYSSAFGFCASTGDMDLEALAADSMLSVRDTSDCDGEVWRVRRVPLNAELIGRGTDNVHLKSGWRPFPDVHITSWLIPPNGDSPYYLRVHRIESARRLQTAEAGWTTHGQGQDGRALVQAFSGETSPGGLQELGAARATTKAGSVGVRDIPIPGSISRMGRLVQSDPGSNVIFARSILPTLVGDIQPGVTWLATAVYGKPSVDGVLDDEWDKAPTVPDYVFQ